MDKVYAHPFPRIVKVDMVLEAAFVPMRNNVPCSQSRSSEVHINFDKSGGGWQTIPYECISKWYFISQKPEQKYCWFLRYKPQ